MHDFPPRVDAFLPGAADRPDTRGPARFLGWHIRAQWDVFVTMALFTTVWQLPGAVSPWLIGKAIDAGVLRGDMVATLGWSAALTGVIIIASVGGVLGHTFVVRSWLIALYGTTLHVGNKSRSLGHVLSRRVPTGEVLSVSTSDSDVFGGTIEVAQRTVAAVVTFGVICALMFSTSTQLGLVVLVVTPLLVVGAAPILRPLSAAQAAERTQNSELTSLATDIVAGLRVLRGIGGERTFGDNYARQSQRVRGLGVRVGTWQGVVETVSVLLSGALLVGLVYLGVHELRAGRLTVGQLISFIGYAVYMVWPMRTFFEFGQGWITGLVSARKTISLLGQPSPWRPADGRPAAAPELRDEASGMVVAPGRFTVVVSADPDAAAALADRLGRYLPAAQHDGDDEDENLRGRALRRARAEKERRRAEIAAADAARAAGPWGAAADGVDYADLDLAALRERVVVSDTAAMLFAGTLQDAVDPWGTHTREQAEAALVTANAEDVFDALPGGWQGVLDEKGRGLSGGQRQRIVLARALLLDPEVLILVEPTSAVDAHTEARIAERLAGHRRGRTTVVMSASPLLLHHADTAVLLESGREAARGTHAELLADARYREIVGRGMGADDD